VTELRSAPDQERFERSLQVIGLEITANATGVSILVGDPDKRWQHMNGCGGCRVDYQFEVEVPPGATVEHTLENGHNQYRIQKMTRVRLGQGGPLFSIASMNGDVRIQKHQ